MRLAIAILAGGKSRRMGRDKALLTRGGATLLARTAALAARAADVPRLVAGRQRPADWQESDETFFLPDDNPGDGPLAAIATCLRYAEMIGCERVLVLPCDLPLLTADALRWLIAQSADATSGDGVTVLGGGDRIEPLFSVYATCCRERVEAQLAQSRRSPTALIEGGDFRRVVAPEWVRAALADADTPEDWEAVRASGNGKWQSG